MHQLIPIVLLVDLAWPELALIRMKVCPEKKKSTSFFIYTVGHLNNPFVPSMGHLPVSFQKILIPIAGND